MARRVPLHCAGEGARGSVAGPKVAERPRAVGLSAGIRVFGGWGSLVLLFGALGGCASSSSETPWPVAPDFERLRFEAKQRRAPSEGGQEWTPREPEGDEPVTPETEPVSTWGVRAPSKEDPPPLRAGKPAPEVEELGDTDEIDSDPFFQDEDDED
ncbi:MAG: hypothetical protein KIT72_01480 [Polyangiaceae bacterium]|nr:hypothetical protein [Polyangiaceae bacterium]MCW5789068.1 hypothetical protein [Polyangiaceae bacterium]